MSMKATKKRSRLSELYPHQKEAIGRLRSGSILCGEVGTGKSRTALGYFMEKELVEITSGAVNAPRDLYIITTAKKRDSTEWLDEAIYFGITTDPDLNPYGIRFVVDSWNNIKKYKDVAGAFFIFDEQRVVGSGAWVKTFLNIARKNHWILLTATPGDVWMDYVPVFVANGFYKNKTEFVREHVIFSPYTNFPKIQRYVNTGRLLKYQRQVLVQMHYEKNAKKLSHSILVDYDKELYFKIIKERWNPYDDEPIEDPGKHYYLARRAVNDNPHRLEAAKKLVMEIDKTIIFYNFTYELVALRKMCEDIDIPYSEWNGEKHQDILKTPRWVYLVQYTAGAEGWNCTETDTIIFYSQNPSYRTTKQAAGRIDRLNTPFKYLNYYYIRSSAPIDQAINEKLKLKQNFNEKAFALFLLAQ